MKQNCTGPVDFNIRPLDFKAQGHSCLRISAWVSVHKGFRYLSYSLETELTNARKQSVKPGVSKDSVSGVPPHISLKLGAAKDKQTGFPNFEENQGNGRNPAFLPGDALV